MRSRRHAFVTALSVLVLAACGGSGGGGGGGGGGGAGGGGGGSSPPPPPPPPAGIAVTDANAAEVMTVGAGVIEAAVQIVLAGVNPLVEILNDGGLQFVRGCGNGTLQVALTDNDADGGLSAGDAVTADYVGACFSSELNDPGTGSIRIDVSEFKREIGNAFLLRGTLTIPGGLTVGEIDTVSVSGTLDVAVVVQRGSFEVLSADIPAGGELRLDIQAATGSATESATSLSVRRFVGPSLQGDRPYTLSATADIQSGLLGGRIDCSTEPALAALDLLDDPIAGRLTCAGSGNSAARIDSERPSAAAPISLLVDSEGDGSFQPVPLAPGDDRWDEFVERDLFIERIAVVSLPAQPGTPSLMPTSLALAVNDVVYAPTNDRLIATTDTSVVDIDPATMTVAQTLPLAGSPGALALSDDESTLWVALDDDSELQRIAYPTLTAGPTFPLGNSYIPNVGPRQVFQMEVAPGTTDLVVLSTPNAVEMLAFDNGVLLAETIDDSDVGAVPPRSFAFRDATTIVGVDSVSSGESAFRISLDPTTGLSVDQELPGLAGRVVSKPGLGNVNAFGSERAFNETTATVEALLDPAFDSVRFYDSVQVDTATGRVYAIGGPLDIVVDVYDENTFAHIGRHGIAGSSRTSVLAGGSLVVATASSVDRYRLEDIQPNQPADPCVRTDLSGLWTEGTYVQLDCAFTEALFDPARDRLYAGLTNFTERGNSIAVIDPATLEIMTYVPINGTPKGMELSADGATLYVVLAETTKVVEIDLETLVLTDITNLGLDATLSRPFIGQDVAATTRAGGEFVVLHDTVGLYGSGSVIGARSTFSGRRPDQIFTSADGGTAIARDFNSVEIFSIDASGVSLVTSLSGVAFPRRSEQRGDFFYEGPGTRFSFASQAAETICTLPPIAPDVDLRVAPDTLSELVFYGAIGDWNSPLGRQTAELVACDPNGQAVGEAGSVFTYKIDQGRAEQLVAVSGDRIVMLTETHMVLLDRPTL